MEKTSMRMLRLRAYYDPEQTAGSHLDHDLSEAIAANDIVCVNYTPTPTRGVSKEVYKEYTKPDKKTEYAYDGHMIINRFYMFREGKNPIQRAIRYLACNIREYQLCTRVSNIELVYSSSTPPTQGMLSAMVAKKLSKRYGRKVPFVFNLQDVFPDSLVNAGMTKEGSLIWKIGRKIEDYTYRNADKIIVISEGFKRNIMGKGVPAKKILVIPNWVDTNDVYPVDKDNNPLFERFNLSRDKFYICYSGNIGHSQNLSLLIETAKAIEKSMPNVFFVVIGEGAAKEELEKMIVQYGLKNIKMFPFQPYQDIASVFSFGNAGLIISKPGIGKSSVPSKTWSILAAGKPVLASFDSDSEVAELVQDIGCGVVAQAGSKEELIKAIEHLYRTDTKSMGEHGRKYVQNELSKDVCTTQYIDAFNRVVQK
jgi:glycosyltransferase involved in cell wall biosynthesis